MQLTEEMARTKWCPFARAGGNNRFYNERTDGFQNTPGAYHCIASDCMAWRELHYSHLKGDEVGLEQHGYCGLAGRPMLE